MSDQITWVSTISSSRFPTYKECIKSWSMLPGNKILYAEGEIKDIENISVIDFFSTIKKDCSWIRKKRPTKAHRFWFKGQTIYHALKQKYSRFIIWIDADVKAISSPILQNKHIQNYIFSAMEFENGGFDGIRGIESGFMIFDTHHERIDELAEEYISYWENETIFNLRRPYDTQVIDEIGKKFGFLNLVGPNTFKKIGENSFLYTDFSKNLIHFIGKENKRKINETMAI